MDEITKCCSSCKVDKPLCDFAISKKKHLGRASECKECHSFLRKQNYRINRINEMKRIKARKKEILSWLRSIKNGLACSKCHESCYACLDFHHVDPSKKESDITLAAQHGWSRDRIMLEMEKCVVLCKNCHAKLHAGIV